MVKAQKGEMVKFFTETQWDNMNKEMKNHGYIRVDGEKKNSLDIPKEIINHQLKIKSLKPEIDNITIAKMTDLKDAIEDLEVPGFEEVKEVEKVEEPKTIVKTKGRPKRK